jgi:hypothetical protein
MRFSVPQFIDVEDKIFGPLTIKQAIYLVGAVGGTYLAYAALGGIGVVFIGLPLLGFAGLLGFVQVNNRPFISVVTAAFFYKMKNKLYLWKKTPPQQKKTEAIAPHSLPLEKIASLETTQSKLRALAFSLDTEEGYIAKDE